MTSTFLNSPEPDETSKVAIVIGASSGIGIDMTIRLIANLHLVIAKSLNIPSAITLQNTGDLAQTIAGPASAQEQTDLMAELIVTANKSFPCCQPCRRKN